MSILQLLLHLDQHLAEFAAQYGAWIYVILFALIFAETGFVVTPFLPGDSLLFVSGALASTGSLNVWILLASLCAAAILGNTSNYWIGRYFGPRVFPWEQSRWFSLRALDQAHAFYERHVAPTLVLARFMPMVRTFAPFVAGVGAMEHTKFQFWNILGAALWVAALLFCGYAFGHIPLVQRNLAWIMAAVVVISLLPLAFAVVRARLAHARPSKGPKGAKERGAER